MKNNQFSIITTSHEQKIAELTRIGFLSSDLHFANSKELWQHFLQLSYPESTNEDSTTEFMAGLLATPTQPVTDFLQSYEPITTECFYLVALQLLQFEPELDFDIHNIADSMQKMQLPILTPPKWNQATVIDAWYLLLCTYTKVGQTFLDNLTSRGLLTPLYDLPSQNKPVFFNGKSVAIFDPHKLIRQVVYVESSLDTDRDQKADLLKVEILRPNDTNQQLKVPVVYTASPYNQGTNDQWGQELTHNVNVPLAHKATTTKTVTTTSFSQPIEFQATNGNATQATQTFNREASYTLNDYLLVRGYAVVYAAGIGTKDSGGMQTCGSPEQTSATIAVIEWLTGKRKAFTNQTDGIEIKAWWCNGNVAMTGRSYLGTLATAAATTGISGLKTIISEAAISSWYDYYRENGLVMAPGGFQGEDADVLAAETFSRKQVAADYLNVKPVFNRYLHEMQVAMDRQTGNYNDFWAERNYRPDLKNVTADILLVHGLNDWNVKPNQAKAVWDQLPKNITKKIILHQGQHIYINAFQSFDFSDLVNLWLSNKLWQLDNGADTALPNVIVQDNQHPQTWRGYENWEENQPQRWYFSNHQLTTATNDKQQVQLFDDHLTKTTFDQYCHNPADWQNTLATKENQFSLKFKTQSTKDTLLLRGTPVLNARVASSVDHGLLSVQLVDFGTTKRFNISPTIIERKGLQLGHLWREDDLREFQLATHPTDFKVISYGHINLQNRHNARENDDLTANQFVDIQLALQPIFHQLALGHQLGVIIFSTDFAMTQRGNESITYQLDLDDCQLTIPTVQRI
ncbi:Xaa-Pro dipeptidyl-peptidase [Paucilactobacillus kaifaensis]|uniref:Xaa-Pro dipeptidyl-peptidase n=1 Tax=Paucilactobacillus kaifaensis TaxID=2559921 RepID=UPI0010F6C49C|nr:Xaa-Pro dipeptidyl-peptidase [Paucilactobacillus kaifaensis]